MRASSSPPASSCSSSVCKHSTRRGGAAQRRRKAALFCAENADTPSSSMRTASCLNSCVYFALMTFFNICSSSRLELSKSWEAILGGNTMPHGGGEGKDFVCFGVYRVVASVRSWRWNTNAMGIVGAGLVPARSRLQRSTGDHKGRPYTVCSMFFWAQGSSLLDTVRIGQRAFSSVRRGAVAAACHCPTAFVSR